MIPEQNMLDTIDAIYDMGRDFVEHPQMHVSAAEYEFNVCAFDEWRRKVIDILYALGGCDDLYYQRFSKEVTRPHVKDLEQGLGILAAVRDELACDLRSEGRGGSGKTGSCGKMSASYH